MNKVVALVMFSITLTGCSSDGLPEKLHNKILYDSKGCAYILKHNAADTMFVDKMDELSKDTCALNKDVE